MTRQAVIKRIYREMKKSQDCIVRYKDASEVLSVVEKCISTLRYEWDWKPKRSAK